MTPPDSTEKYLLLRKIYEGQLFRYGVAAGSGFLTDQLTYLICYYWIFAEKEFPVASWMITPRVPSLLISFSAGLIVNFSISKYFVFKSSFLRGRTQFFRFIHVTCIIFILNYMMMRFLEDQLGMESGLSRFVAAASISLLSFFLHKTYTFKVRNEVTR
jgi:putative flippase GtrA